jgi:cytochrome c peroxidase
MKQMKTVDLALFLILVAAAQAQNLRSLKAVPTPSPRLTGLVRDRDALMALGKAFFWDTQTGSDGRTACATCHFHAGADHRPQNQLSDPNAPFIPNRVLSTVAFPFRSLSDPNSRNSIVLWDTSNRLGSAGGFRRSLIDIARGEPIEQGADLLDRPEFMVNGLQVRRVTTRNSPSVINAVFSVRNFWDGRASRNFNGFTVTGQAADAPGILVWANGALARETISLDNASLASQAVGPIMDHLEMSYEGRTWPKLGRKLLSLRPLRHQRVAADDSVLGSMARQDGPGLQDQVTYLALMQKAFEPRLWESPQAVDENGTPGGQFTQAEYNFPLMWGLALYAYQATLVSNDSPFDRFMEGDSSALTAQEQDGMRFFQTTGRCTTCHNGAEFSAASFTASGNGGRNGGRAFQQTGVRPVSEDAGSGGGSFKSIGLRNVELTGPYFHNGGQATLEQVVDFYVRGGDFANNAIRPFNATPAQKASLVAFLKALTDDRVRYERAPFDHPELCVPVGHTATEADPAYPRSAIDQTALIEGVGATGNLVPLRTFEEMLRGAGGDGSRAHTLTHACRSTQ